MTQIETIKAAIADGEMTLEQAAEQTGWPIIDGCLVPAPGTWHADDGNAEIEIECGSAREAAREYVDGGDWGDRSGTCWIGVGTWRIGVNEAGEEVQVGFTHHDVTLEPEEPECSEDEHDWQSPFELVGGTRDNPGVWGNGGGVYIHEVCLRCGCGKTIDTWAQNRNTGEQGLRSVRYEPDKYADEVERYLTARIKWEADANGVRGTLPAGTSCYWAVTVDGDLELDEAASDHWPPTGDYEWPKPPDAVAAEALELAAASADEAEG